MDAERPLELRRIIGDDDATDGPLPPMITPELAVELFRRMVLLRTYDERSLILQRHGRIGTYALFWGHEAIQAGAASAVRDDDWILPSYREIAIGILRGMPIHMPINWVRGHPKGYWNPQEYKMGLLSVPVGSHIPHAAGVAWGERLQGRDTVALALFGDGATSEGDFHEGLNFASVFELPVVFVCNNNQWAITTPITRQTRARALVDKAVGYGMAGVRVDGTDVLAVYQAVHEATVRARAGKGPTFIEAVHYRATLHATADDPTRYRDDTEAALARKNECLGRYQRYLMAKGLLTEEAVAEMRAVSAERMARAVAEAESFPEPEPNVLFDYVYETPLPEYARDLSALRASLKSE